jgi:phosphatidylglycerophosphate synthase
VITSRAQGGAIISRTRARAIPPAWIVRPPGGSATRIFGLTPEERLRRSLVAAGCKRVEVVDAGTPTRGPEAGTALAFSSDAIFDERLVRGMIEQEDALLVAPTAADGWGGPVAAHVAATRLPEAIAAIAEPGSARAVPAGWRPLAPAEVAPGYIAALRKFEPPYVHPARPECMGEVERLLFGASYKGATDLVTKWVWPRPAAALTRRLAAAGVRPNSITLASWVLVILAAWLFLEGWFGAGLVCAWWMTFLDTVDGKLARVTLTSSRIGHVLDHGLDLVHPPFWYLAWGLGLAGGHGTATAIVVGGYFLGRALEGIFLYAFKMETHCWRPIDTLFRTITARRNPNLILLTVGTLGGRPDLGLVMVAIWTAASMVFHFVRMLQAFVVRARGGTVAPWDETLGSAAIYGEATAEDRSAA